MIWKKWVVDIREKTSGMDRKSRCSYILTYYWPHILGSISIVALILLFSGHYIYGNKKPEFTCVMVDQGTDTDRDSRMAESFAEENGLDSELVTVDSSYIFSYGEYQMQGVDESSYEKFFFQWRNQELDAVIMPESFYQYCLEMGGSFRIINVSDTGTLEPYMDGGECRGVILGMDSFAEEVFGVEEQLLLAFPETEREVKYNKEFLSYICHLYE